MLGLKIVKNDQVKKWKYIESAYIARCEENRSLKMQLRDEQELISNLKNKLQGTEAVIYDIKKDKMENDSYIYVYDRRVPFFDYDSQEVYFKGFLNLFVLSAEMYPSALPGRYVDMPYLQADFGKTEVVINELHSDVDDWGYENMGYATMMLDVLVTIAKKSNCTSIIGKLSRVDAETEEKKEKRNGFYASRGFEISFVNDLQEEGSVCLHI